MGWEPVVRALVALIGLDGPDHAHLHIPSSTKGPRSTKLSLGGSFLFSELWVCLFLVLLSAFHKVLLDCPAVIPLFGAQWGADEAGAYPVLHPNPLRCCGAVLLVRHLSGLWPSSISSSLLIVEWLCPHFWPCNFCLCCGPFHTESQNF